MRIFGLELGGAIRAMVLALTPVCAAARGQAVVFEHSTATVMDRAVVLPADQFNPAFIDRMSQQFLQEAKGKFLARLTLATTPDSLVRALFHSGINPTFESTIEEIRRYKLPELPVARLLLFRGAAVLSYRDSKGYSERVLAGAEDPTHFREGRVDLQLLHFVLRKPGPALDPSQYSVRFFLKASPEVSIAACTAATKWLAAQTRVPIVDVEVRRGAWFLGFEFPAMFLFEKTIPAPPNRLLFEIGPYVTCGVTERYGTQCTGQNFRP